MSVGAISLDAVGVLAQETVLELELGSAITTPDSKIHPFGQVDLTYLKVQEGLFFSHGLSAHHHLIEDTLYRSGILAPYTAPDMSITGAARATAVFTHDGSPTNFVDGDRIAVGRSARTILFKAALVTDGSLVDQVLIGATPQATILNLKALIEDNHTQGVDAWNYFTASGYTSQDYDKFWYEGSFGSWGANVEISASTAFTLTFRAIKYGAIGNSYLAWDQIDGAGIFTFGVGVPPNILMTGGADGTGNEPDPGNYEGTYAFYRQGDLAQSAVALPATEFSKDSSNNIDFDTLDSPETRDAVTHWRLFRNEPGGQLLYKDQDALVSGGLPITDGVSNDDLVGDFALIYDRRRYRSRSAGYPVVGKCAAIFNGRLFTGGVLPAAQYSIGDVTTVVGSRVVTFANGAKIGAEKIGRFFQVAGDTDEYLIVSVNEAALTAELAFPFRGTAGAGLSYTVTDKRDPFEVHVWEPDDPNLQGVDDSLRGVTSKNPYGLTAINALKQAVAVHTLTGLWKIVGSEDSGYRIKPEGEGMGAFNQQCVWIVGGAMYWLGPEGVWRWDGVGSPEHLSKPPVDVSGARGIQGTIDRLNVEEGELAFANYNESLDVIRWFVPLDDEPTCRYAIVLDLQTMAFTTDLVEDVTCATSVLGADGTFRTVAGDLQGHIWELDSGYSDGVYGIEPVQTIAAYDAGAREITLSGTPLPAPSAPFAGATVVAVNEATGEFERAKILGHTDDTVFLQAPFQNVTPGVGWKLVMGGIIFDVMTGQWAFKRPEVKKGVVAVTLSYTPQSVGQLWCALGLDGAAPTLATLPDAVVSDECLLTDSDGEYKFWFRSDKCVRAQLRFLALTPGFHVDIDGYVPTVRMRREVGG